MGTRRFDVLQVDGRWLLTDSGARMRWFLSSQAALAEGTCWARARELPTIVYLWQGGEASEVYRNKAAEPRTKAAE